ncbi:PH domain-containing protein [Fulvivirga sedimenti]|uniref:PH domain-containing protein n=1 Tax=Fulvivirga sedimenti TaxID=2879465 RepID=A0A9X1HWX7_9BACT|nr:PH domain-containing protein [Fulvivirga sedimenti]MCA6079151.1 PH domain-containing protein [Fulvivirga sedimenti]
MNHQEYKFKSKQTFWVLLIYWFTIGVSIFAIVMVLLKGSEENIWIKVFAIVMMSLSAGLIIWIWLGTRYVVREEKLYYYSGPVRGVIPINSIRKLEVGRTLWVGVRPALATGGIIIYYGSSDLIYVSPDTNEKFIQCITAINHKIQVDRQLFK